MREILGNNLAVFFFNAEISAKRTYEGQIYEVWEISEADYEKICNMSEEDFADCASNDEAWWRGSEGSNMGIPYVKYTINGKKIIAWDRPNRERSRRNRRYSTLLEYMCEEIGASQPRNVCALAVDLAKYNNMTMGELFAKYEG